MTTQKRKKAVISAVITISACVVIYAFIFWIPRPVVLSNETIDDNESVLIFNTDPEPQNPTNNTKPISVTEGANDFAFRISSELAKNSGDENLVFSPFSVWLPLAALVNATDAENQPVLKESLGAAGASASVINNTALRLLEELNRTSYKKFDEYHNPVQIVNAIFVDNSVTIKQEFAQIFAEFYGGSATNVDFYSQEAIDEINKWASENTDGLITNVVREFPIDTMSAIVNAIYYSDKWAWEFDPKQTNEGIFHSPAGDINAFYMPRKDFYQPYYEDEKVQATPLEFLNGGGMLIILPKSESAAETLSLMTNEYFNKILADSGSVMGTLLLPRFSIENEVPELKKSLEMLGIPLFNIEKAALTGGLIEEDFPIWVSDVIQKTMIKVDEKGTTAAAVSVVEAALGAPELAEAEPFEMICDRPFVFVLYDRNHTGSNQILFTGIVNKP